MPTFLFDKIVFGPVKSRRLGVSLGINLLPTDGKFCNFNCVYCECGLNSNSKSKNIYLPSKTDTYNALEAKLSNMLDNHESLDVITFAGNGEPTMHPDFADIISDTISLRAKYYPDASISVLTNSTMLHKPSIAGALKKIDLNIVKLDSGLFETINDLNQPVGNYSLETTINLLKQFEDNLIIQTMFVRGNVDNKWIDNTTEENLSAWINAIKEISPKKVMIYTIERDTPFQGLKKIEQQELVKISELVTKLGISVQVSG